MMQVDGKLLQKWDLRFKCYLLYFNEKVGFLCWESTFFCFYIFIFGKVYKGKHIMEDKKTYEIFDDKTLGDVFEDIYKNSTVTRNQVKNLIEQLKPYIQGLDAAVIIVPLVKEYLDISIKNDEHLIKLADTVQKMLRSEKSDGGGSLILTDDEKDQLLGEVEDYSNIKRRQDDKKEKLDKQVEKIKKELNLDTKTSDGEETEK